MSKRSKLARITLVSLVTLALATLLGRAAQEVVRGNGAGTYGNAYGMQIQWVTVLTFATLTLVAATVALAIRWWQKRDDRMIDRLLRTRRNQDSERP
jgi:uncharacterized membrane protein